MDLRAGAGDTNPFLRLSFPAAASFTREIQAGRMTSSDFQLRGVGDPRLAVHATSPWPVWLWSTDGARVLWANPVGARLFGAAHGAALADRIFGPADSHRRQVARLARQLPADGTVRLERLRGFGARLGTLMTCACSRLDFADGSHAVLVSAMDPALRSMPLIERLHRLVDGAKMPMAAFAPDGLFVGASEAARALLGFRDLGEAGLEQARNDALRDGRAETPIGIGQMVLQRVGKGADVGLIALIEPAAAAQAKPPEAAPAPTADEAREAPVAPAPQDAACEPPASQDGSAGISLFDAFAEPVEAPAATEATAPEAQDIAAVEAAAVEPAAQEQEPAHEAPDQAADIAPKTPVENPQQAMVSPQAGPNTSRMVEPPSDQELSGQELPGQDLPGQEPPAPRQHPLRFLWQTDAEGRFVLLSDEFIHLIGARTAAGFGRPWGEIAAAFSLDPDGRVAQALASHDTWAGITANWPADGGEHLPVEPRGLADLRCRARFRRLQGLWRLPRSRRSQPARCRQALRAARDAPGRTEPGRRCGGAGA